jgi:hypothetical protein
VHKSLSTAECAIIIDKAILDASLLGTNLRTK